MGSEAPEESGSDSGDDSTDDSTGIGPTTRRGVLVGLTTGAGIGLGAAAAARGPPEHAGNDAGTGGGNNGRAPAGNDDTPGRGPPDQVIVGTTTQAAADEAAKQAREVRHKLDFGDHGKAVAGRFPEPARTGLANRPDVRYVEPDATFEAVAQSTPWGVDRVDADTVHGDGTTGDGADIAIIDTGIDSDHPDLVDNLGSGTAYVEAGTDYDGSSCSGNGNTYYESWDDDNDHGTHCAGTAAGVSNSEGVIGVAPGATLHAVKVLACSGTGYLSDIAAGVEYTANQGWDVASMSLGASSSYSTLRDACQYAADEGVLVVAAAGNDGPCSDCVSYPATYDSVVAVSATTSADDLASFSSTGPEIDIAAPGSSILSTVPGGEAYFSGTSMACPHVSGVGGLLMANGYTGSEARSALQNNTEDIGLSGSDGGNGLLNAEGALGGSEPSMFNAKYAQTKSIDSVGATFVGELTGLGGADYVKAHFKYWEKDKKSDTVSWTGNQKLTDTGTYTASVDGLGPETTYEVRTFSFKPNKSAWSASDVYEFTTAGEFTIGNLAASQVSGSSVEFSAELFGLDGADTVKAHFKYWEKGAKSSTAQWTCVLV